jgi:predicted nucleotidyltransferase
MPRAWPRWRKSAGSIIAGGTVLNQDFKEFIQSLNDNGVRYLLIGGYAVAVHGYPRYTKDMDIWVEMSEENAAKIVKALNEFGFASLGLKETDFLAPDQIVQLGYPPGRIDILTTVPGVEFVDCYPTRVATEVDGVTVSCIDLENLVKNKKATGRHQDWADVENLE